MDNAHPPRRNTEMASIVDQAIALDARLGAANAWVYMASAQVPLPVVKRVLGMPAQRRSANRIN
ncbi:hypothetical protein H3H36_15450 [Duganella sp. FT3S]|uniref:Uncharacterized protein n=1 Tax=Rugamonas fusca TaxID=2758568 RepID=A0A7W2I7S5_9BURK|nr:hypothetical protein [Rugamonas fusca]MBA5606754.1 hypothetical protein [Rugamonas fusca]